MSRFGTVTSLLLTRFGPLILALGCRGEAPPAAGDSSPKPPAVAVQVQVIDAKKAEEIETFCALCHLAPRGDYFPKHAWHEEVVRAFGFWAESGRSDAKVPSIADVETYYRNQAPDKLEFPVPKHAARPFPVQFEREETDLVPAGKSSAIAHVRWTKLNPDAGPVFVTCDMRLGEVRAFDPGQPTADGKLLATAKFPCRAEPVDLDGDGAIDLLVADLGSPSALDHQLGRVLWLKQSPRDGSWTTIELLTKVGRVADVRAADFDGDGDSDLIVAEFGWHKTGSVFWLETKDLAANPPQFERHDLDPRPGAIHVPIVDVNSDGRPDFLALMSQDYEEVLAWVNQGDGTFVKQVVSDRQEPSFGSSGLELVDLDGDGDQDLLYTNGDTFDSRLAKPYHGVQWLENQGQLPYKLHRLADMMGAYRAAAADLDGDGDLDVVLGGFLPNNLIERPPLERHDSLAILEQVAPGRFERHALTQGSFHHTSFEVADFNDDGRADIATGMFYNAEGSQQPRITVWWNKGQLGSDKD